MRTNAVRRAGGALTLVMTLSVVAAVPVHATDPLSPVRLSVPAQGFVLPVEFEAISANQIHAELVFQRIAGQVVDANALTVGGVLVRRPLAIESAGEGHTLDAFPLGPGVPSLPNGIYSERVQLVVMPDPGFAISREVTARATLYFRAINGTFERLTIKQYSALVEPLVPGKDKLQQPTLEHVGANGSAGSTVPATGFDLRIENGAPFYVPGQVEPPSH